MIGIAVEEHVLRAVFFDLNDRITGEKLRGFRIDRILRIERQNDGAGRNCAVTQEDHLQDRACAQLLQSALLNAVKSIQAVIIVIASAAAVIVELQFFRLWYESRIISAFDLVTLAAVGQGQIRAIMGDNGLLSLIPGEQEPLICGDERGVCRLPIERARQTFFASLLWQSQCIAVPEHCVRPFDGAEAKDIVESDLLRKDHGLIPDEIRPLFIAKC